MEVGILLVLKLLKELEKKLLNYAHHYEFQVSGLKIDDIKKFISEKRIIYDYMVDQKEFKWSGRKIKKLKFKLPKYVSNNLDKYKEWLRLEE